MPTSQVAIRYITNAKPRMHRGCTIEVRIEGLLPRSGPPWALGVQFLDLLICLVAFIRIPQSLF